MDTLRNPSNAQLARDTADEIIDCLQQAHFAARRLEDYMPPDPQDRLVDRIHAAHTMAQQALAAIQPAPAAPRR